MSEAFIGMGTKFQRYVSNAFVDLAEVFNIQGPGMSREVVEVTSYDSEDGFREKIGGLRDGGTVTFSMNFTHEGYSAVKADFDDDNPRQYRILLTDNSSFTFDGLVTELPLGIPEGDRIVANITIEITGPVDFDEET